MEESKILEGPSRAALMELEALVRKLDSEVTVVHLNVMGEQRYILKGAAHDTLTAMKLWLWKRDRKDADADT